MKEVTMIEKTLLFTKHWEITTTYSIFEILLPDGRFLMWTWDNSHKLIDKCTWYL